MPVFSVPTFDQLEPESVETCHWILTVPPPGSVEETLKVGDVPVAAKTLLGLVIVETLVGAFL